MSGGRRTGEIKNETDPQRLEASCSICCQTLIVEFDVPESDVKHGVTFAHSLLWNSHVPNATEAEQLPWEGCQRCEYSLLKLTWCQEDAKGNRLKGKTPSEDLAQAQKDYSSSERGI